MDRTATRSVTCEECVEVLVDYVDGTLEAREIALFERHFADCPPCQDFLSTYRATIRVSKACLQEEVEIPPEVSKRLRSFLRERCKK